LDDISVGIVGGLAQTAEGCDFAIEQISCDIVIDFGKFYDFYGYSSAGGELAAFEDVASGSFSEE
jgi:hypothetical protein